MKNSIAFVTENEMINFFKQFVGSALMQIVTLTEVGLLKKSRETSEPTPFNVLQHIKNFNLQVGYNYEKQVNDKAESEGFDPDFVAEQHKWAEHVEGALFCRRKDKGGAYIAYAQKRVDDSEYFADGQRVKIGNLEEYLKNKPTNYTNQPAENKVRVQMVKAENILSYTFNGIQHYVIR